ncbi:Rap1a/Tai family immunity protein [Collimonas sp. H4R21]|uniref:Rap1a/Tai family immunity protein n=1 Tax=Collimonas rhizosphaerae TaxID=3126357 RepID=A0ABU9PU92_9BURK
MKRIISALLLIFPLIVGMFPQLSSAQEAQNAAEAVNVTGNQIMAGCQIVPSDVDFCRTLFLAVTNKALLTMGNDGLPLICPPPGATLLQAVAIVEKDMIDHPTALHFPAVELAVVSLFNAFPCRKHF